MLTSFSEVRMREKGVPVGFLFLNKLSCRSVDCSYSPGCKFQKIQLKVAYQIKGLLLHVSERSSVVLASEMAELRKGNNVIRTSMSPVCCGSATFPFLHP